MKTYKTALIILLILFVSCEDEQSYTDNVKNIDFDGLHLKIISTDIGNLIDVFFINDNIGYVVGKNGMIKKTIDGGKNWLNQESGTIKDITTVFFLNENEGFASGEIKVHNYDDVDDRNCVFLKTLDGGKNWTKVLKPEFYRFLDIHFFNSNEGIAVLETSSAKKCVASSVDGGSTWNYLQLDIQGVFDNRRIFVNDNVCSIKGDEQKLYKSYDFGNSWDTIQTPIQMSHVCFETNDLIFISDYNEIFKTEDGGKAWQKIPTSFSTHLFHFSNKLNGFSVDYVDGDYYSPAVASKIMITSDGGINWTEKEIPNIISGCSFYPSSNLGYCINENEVITITMD